jgi:hypothetical protein
VAMTAPKIDARTALPKQNGTEDRNGLANDIAAGALPATPATCASRADGLSCTSSASAAVDTAGKVVSAIGIPAAQAAVDAPTEEAEIVVVGKRLPKTKSVKMASAPSAPSVAPSNIWSSAAAAPATSADGSSIPDTTLNVPSYIAPVISRPTAALASTSPAASAPTASEPAPAPSAPSQTSPTAALTAGARVGLSGAAVATASTARGTGSPSLSSGGPSPAAASQRGDIRAPANEPEVRTFRDAASMQTFLEHDYAKIQSSLGQTQVVKQLIDYQIEVRQPLNAATPASAFKEIGCYPKNCQPKKIYQYCPRKKRLAENWDC